MLQEIRSIINRTIIVICYWTQNLAIVQRYWFKIKSVIRYETKKLFVIRD